MDAWIIDLMTIISIITGALSIVTAIIAINLSKNSERETRENFDKTKDVLNKQYEKNKDVLAEINKTSAVIENTVKEGQQKLMDTVTTILKETAIPKQISQEEQLQAELIQAFLKNPKEMTEIMKMFPQQQGQLSKENE